MKLLLSSRVESYNPHLKGYFLAFESKRAELNAKSSLRLFLVWFLLEGLIGPRMDILRRIHLHPPALWIRVPVLIAVALLLVSQAAKIKLKEIGLSPWREWNLIQKSYFIQILLISNAAFILNLAHPILKLLSDESMWSAVILMIVAQIGWGFYQELAYRGILQSALVSRFGAPIGLLISNLAFTFGPLHYYHFAGSHASINFSIIFATGLFFSLLFWKSNNLWLVGTLHGIGDIYIDGLHTISK